MIKRITIYGDSFADPKYIRTHPTWYRLLEDDGYEVTNLGESGSGPMFSFKHMYRNAHRYIDEDLIVFILSGVNRLCITSDHEKDAQLFDNIDEDLKKILRDELTYGNWKYESFLYALSREQRCKIFTYFLDLEESYFKTKLNNDNYYCHCEGLADVSWKEYVKEERERDASDDIHFRANHLSEENHILMYQQITNFMHDVKPIPNFLQGIYKGTYNDKEFVYD